MKKKTIGNKWMDLGWYMNVYKICILTPSASQSIDYSLSVLGVKNKYNE